MKTLPLERVDCIVTDPPYGIGFASQPTKWQRRAGNQAEYWDEEAPDITQLLEMKKPSVIFGGNYFPLPVSRCWVVWIKPDAPPSMGSVEMAWTNFDAPSRHIVHSISATNKERVGHPTQKPLRVMRWIIANFTKESDVVFDPFMGSGTTGVACMQLGRGFIGCEIDPRHYAKAERRIRQASLQLAMFTPANKVLQPTADHAEIEHHSHQPGLL